MERGPKNLWKEIAVHYFSILLYFPGKVSRSSAWWELGRGNKKGSWWQHLVVISEMRVKYEIETSLTEIHVSAAAAKGNLLQLISSECYLLSDKTICFEFSTIFMLGTFPDHKVITFLSARLSLTFCRVWMNYWNPDLAAKAVTKVWTLLDHHWSKAWIPYYAFWSQKKSVNTVIFNIYILSI